MKKKKNLFFCKTSFLVKISEVFQSEKNTDATANIKNWANLR